MQCVNKNTREYQTLLKLSGLSDFELSVYVGEYLDTLGRYPYLDELLNADSSKAISKDLSLNKDNITKTENILLATNTNTVEEAVPVLNDKYRDKEIEVLEIGSKSKVYVTTRPNESGNVDLLDEIEMEMKNIKEKTISNGTYMTAPNGKPTNLEERQWLLIRTQAFKQWFGDWMSFDKANPYSLNITLGDITMDFDSADMHGAGAMIPIKKDGKFIGSIALNAYYRAKDRFEPWGKDKNKYVSMSSVGDAVEIDEDQRGKGYGKAAYFEMAKLAARNGLTLISAPDSSRTNAATRVWESLVRDGYAKRVENRYEFINSSLNNASKVVDENGEPLVVYRIDGDKFNIFDRSYIGTNLEPYFGRGFYFTPSFEYATMFPGTYVRGFFLNAKKEYNIKDSQDLKLIDLEKTSDSINWIKEKGKEEELVVFNPNQIKSADINSGKFSSTNNDITDNEVNSFYYFNEIIDKLQTLYGINIIPITNAELSLERWASITGTKGVKSFIYNGNIYINTDIATVDSPVHEFLHLLFGSMKYQNRALYDLLVSLAELFDSYNTISLNYPNRTKGDINEEVFVTELSKYITNQNSAINNLSEANKKEIMYNINRTLDTVLMGENSVKSVQDPYNFSLRSLAQLVNASTMISEKRGSLTDATLNRMMANTKSELMKNRELREECQ